MTKFDMGMRTLRRSLDFLDRMIWDLPLNGFSSYVWTTILRTVRKNYATSGWSRQLFVIAVSMKQRKWSFPKALISVTTTLCEICLRFSVLLEYVQIKDILEKQQTLQIENGVKFLSCYRKPGASMHWKGAYNQMLHKLLFAFWSEITLWNK